MSLDDLRPLLANEDRTSGRRAGSSASDVPSHSGLPSVFASDTPPVLIVTMLAIAGAVVVGTGASLGAPAGLAALLAVAGAVAVLLWPAVGGLALICLVPLLSGVARGLPVPGVKLSELLVLGAAGLVLLTSGWCGRFRLDVLDLFALAYVVATAALGLYNLRSLGEPLSVETATVLFAPVQFLLIFRAVRVSLSTPELRRKALRWVLYLSTLVSLVALAQQLAGPTVNPLLEQLTGSSLVLSGNSTGLFASKHDLGGYLLVVVLLAAALLLTPSQRAIPRVPLLVVLLLASLALVLSVAFAAVGGAVLGVFLMARRRQRVLRVLGAFVAVAATAAVLFGSTIFDLSERQFTAPPVVTSNTSAPAWLPQSVGYRTVVWQDQYIPALTPHLLTGYGPSLPPGVSWEYTESAYLSLLLRGGLMLLLVFAALNLVIYARANQTQQGADPTQRALGLTVLTLVIVVAIVNATNPYILNMGLSHLFWMLAALVAPPRLRTPDQEAVYSLR